MTIVLALLFGLAVGVAVGFLWAASVVAESVKRIHGDLVEEVKRLRGLG